MMDYDMPQRNSPLLPDIDRIKLLQDEQIRLALSEYQKLLYYVSGGQVKPPFEMVDKVQTTVVEDGVVRPEDADLRGWFTQAYGDEYLSLLTSKDQNLTEKGEPKNAATRAQAIITSFNTEPYGFGLRVGALNEYHLGRIIAHASNVYKHRTEASAYSEKLTVLCAKVLFSGSPPTARVFDTLHSSIDTWHEINDITPKPPLINIVSMPTTAKNASDYFNHLIFTLFDMIKAGYTSEKFQSIIDGTYASGYISADRQKKSSTQNISEILRGGDAEKVTRISVEVANAYRNILYKRVKEKHGFNWEIVLDSDDTLQFHIPAQFGSTVSNQNYIDIGKIIHFYARAYQSGTPLAYWTNVLSHRLIVQDAGSGISSIYIYPANISTGGIGSDNLKIGVVEGDINSALATAASYLPEVPPFSPGKNAPLRSGLKQSVETKMAEDEQLSSWLTNPLKERFDYAYVVKSAWGYKGDIPYTLAHDNASHNDARLSTDRVPYKGVKTFKPTQDTLKWSPREGKTINNPAYFEGKGSLYASQSYAVAVSKDVSKRIVAFLDEVPIKIRDMLNKVSFAPNTGWYESSGRLSPNTLYGNTGALKADWPEYSTWVKAPDRGPNARWLFFDSGKLLNDLEVMRTFLANRTESLFITNPAGIIEEAYSNLRKSKPIQFSTEVEKALEAGFTHNLTSKIPVADFTISPPTTGWGAGFNPQSYSRQHELTKGYEGIDFGPVYNDYMALLGTIAYFNSHEFLAGKREYAWWAEPFKSGIEVNVNSILAGAKPIVIYSEAINDTEDVVKTHKILKDLGAFEGMSELPVFDVKEFHIKWKEMNSTGKNLTTPFMSNGWPSIPQEGLKADAYPRLSNSYGDVFYKTIIDSCVLQSRLTSKDSYIYSTSRIPVNTRGVTGKVYGMRPGTIYSFNAETSMTEVPMSRDGSKGLTYTQLGVGIGALYVPVLAYLMYKNFGTGYKNQKWKAFK
jgi:hypothetical protein